MKLLYVISLLCLPLIYSSAQVINIPDPIFKAKLISGNNVAFDVDGTNYTGDADTNNNDEIELSEAMAVTGLKVNTPVANNTNDILSLEGIENFLNLKKLNCGGNNIQAIDVSLLTSLKYLDCNNNNLATLNISGLTQLEQLWCFNNNLTSLNVDGLTGLRAIYAFDNAITAVQIENLPLLEVIEFSSNELDQINITNTPSLVNVLVGGNNLSSFDTNNLSTLTYLDVSFNDISSLNLSPLTTLFFLYAGDNPISQIDVNVTPTLHTLYINNTLISEIDCSNNDVKQLFADNNPNLVSVNVQNEIISFSDPDMLYYAFGFDNTPLLTSICIDPEDLPSLAHTNYNAGGNAHIYTGINCDEELFLNVDGITSAQYNLYPNPASQTITIAAGNGNDIQDIEIYNSLGQLVKNKKDIGSSVQVDIAGLATGNYYIKVYSSSGGVKTEKLIKI